MHPTEAKLCNFSYKTIKAMGALSVRASKLIHNKGMVCLVNPVHTEISLLCVAAFFECYYAFDGIYSWSAHIGVPC